MFCQLDLSCLFVLRLVPGTQLWFGAVGMAGILAFPSSAVALWAGVVIYGFFNGPTIGYVYDLCNRTTAASEKGMSKKGRRPVLPLAFLYGSYLRLTNAFLGLGQALSCLGSIWAPRWFRSPSPGFGSTVAGLSRCRQQSWPATSFRFHANF